MIQTNPNLCEHLFLRKHFTAPTIYKSFYVCVDCGKKFDAELKEIE